MSAANLLDELTDTGATILAEYFAKANLTEILTDETRTLTLFAPTNEAFDQLEPASKDQLNRGGGHSTEVAFTLLIQQPRVRISVIKQQCTA